MLSYVEKLKEGVDEYVEWFYENYDNKLNRVDGGIDVGDGIIIDDWIVMNYISDSDGIGIDNLSINMIKNYIKLNNGSFYFGFDVYGMKYDCVNNKMKVGNKYNKMILGYGKKIGKIKIGSYIKSDIGENLKIVDKTFKNLKNNWFDGWEFNVLDKQLYCNHFSIDKNGKDRRYYDDKCNVDYGNFLEIKNDKVGRILLGEYEEDRFGDKYEFKVVVKSLSRYREGEKGKMGSVLTILNRVCKGNDILIEIEVGSINNSDLISDGDIKYNERKLESWYEKRGFKSDKMKSFKSGIKVMDSRVILEEYCDRMGYNDE